MMPNTRLPKAGLTVTWSTVGRGFVLSTLALTLAACQSLRGPQPEVTANTPAAFNKVADAADVASGPSIAAQGWKEFFADQRLQQLIQLGLENNRDLRATALNIERARAQYRISEGALFPTVNANAGVTRADNQQSSGPQTNYSVGLGVTAYELDFFGRVRDLKDASLQNYLATKSARDATQISLVGQIAQSWLAISYDTAQLQLAEQTLKAQEESYKLNKRRFDVGIDNEVSVRQAQISVETARGNVATYKAQIAQDRNLLELLVGQQVSNDLLPTDQIKQITTASTLGAGLPSDLLQNRPDLTSAEYQLRAAGANLGAARAALFPSISLTGSAGYASTDLSDLFKSGSFVWSVGPQLNLPIFDLGTRRSNVKIAEVDQKLAVNSYEKAIQTAFREVSDALATRATIGDRLSAQTRLVDATSTNYRLSNARFKAGIDSYLTVLDAQRTQYSAQQGLLNLQLANLVNQVELYKTLGGGVKASSNETASAAK